jgi:hypothetical protein
MNQVQWSNLPLDALLATENWHCGRKLFILVEGIDMSIHMSTVAILAQGKPSG